MSKAPWPVAKNHGVHVGGTPDTTHTTEGSTGNPGTQLPWDGADATDIPSTGATPPLKGPFN